MRAPLSTSWLRRATRSVGAKLFTVVLLVLLVNLGFLGYVNVRLHREHLERAGAAAAQRLNDVIRRSASYYMLHNDRPALAHMVQTVGQQPAIVGLRILTADGRVAFSTRPEEAGTTTRAPAAGTRIFRQGSVRVLAIATPVMNAPSCANGACHAHPASQKVLGVLDTQMSLAAADADVRAASRQFILYSALAIVFTLAATGVFVWHFVHKPVRSLRAGTERLARGELGAQIPAASRDELGALAAAFNVMSRKLSEAQQEITRFTHTLEERVERKTAELSRAQDQMIQAEKLTSLGKLAAVVAHEINNPLSGILTYAKLMRKWVDRGETLEKRGVEMHDALSLIESESRRCGEIVRSLLTFARVAPMNVSDFDVQGVIRQCIKLVEHKLELGNITAEVTAEPRVPLVQGDAGQIEQLLLALIMNAIEAMPREGNLRVTVRSTDSKTVAITVEDDGSGIDPALLPRLFDPFVTTKEEGKGVGLGLAICKSIVDRHHGTIGVVSEPGRGTTFTITLPAAAPEAADPDRVQEEAVV